MLAKAQALARISQQAKLNREPEPVAATPFGADKRQILGAEHIMFSHLAGFGRDAEHAGALVGREQGSASRLGLRFDVGGPLINRLFGTILKQDCESRFLWKSGAPRS